MRLEKPLISPTTRTEVGNPALRAAVTRAQSCVTVSGALSGGRDGPAADAGSNGRRVTGDSMLACEGATETGVRMSKYGAPAWNVRESKIVVIDEDENFK
ncbi:MAG: hypothetical protein HBSAPP03_16550 [Phycisphaerae bacterium]|nr:MAG: hypothetical protein HBSAPP03_16550 [Phycisphaerae bacterium]